MKSASDATCTYNCMLLENNLSPLHFVVFANPEELHILRINLKRSKSIRLVMSSKFAQMQASCRLWTCTTLRVYNKHKHHSLWKVHGKYKSRSPFTIAITISMLLKKRVKITHITLVSLEPSFGKMLFSQQSNTQWKQDIFSHVHTANDSPKNFPIPIHDTSSQHEHIVFNTCVAN